jgi:hypothetical protein
VLVLDALSGKPQSGMDVLYFCEGNVNEHRLNGIQEVVATDDTGVASIPFKCPSNVRIILSVVSHTDRSWREKEECGGVEPQTLNQILATGFISDPASAGSIWCPVKISKKLKPIPGQVTVFVKKPTWWQAHVAG